MLRTLLTVSRLLFYALLILIGVTFAVGNRTPVDVNLFPFPYIFAAPLFLIVIFAFLAGSILGWAIAHRRVFSYRRKHRESEKRRTALENEISATRSEQMHKPAAIAVK